MLKPAGLYENEVKRLFAEIAFDEEYMYANTSSWREPWSPSADTWNKHEFVSVNESGQVVGFFSYRIDRDSLTTSSFQAINFRKKGLNRTFGNDLRQIILDIFLKFQFRKLNFSVVVGNPAEAFYDEYINQIGGRVLGFYESDVKLMDGNYYDLKIYEVMKDDFVNKHRKTTVS